MKAALSLMAPLVETEVQRILISPQFASSDRLQRFLRYIVTQTIEGNSEHLKESVIGVQVFDLKIGFDPKVDAVVRVTARRLREKLEQFYLENPNDSGIVILLPKGGYVPDIVPTPQREVTEAPAVAVPVEAVPDQPVEIETVQAAPLPVRSNLRWWILGGVALAAAIGFVLVLRQAKTSRFAGPVSHFTINLPGDQRIVSWYGNDLAFSPDGQTLAYVALQDGKRRLFLRELAKSESMPVAGSDSASAPFFAPDGKSLAYYTSTELRRLFLDGRASNTEGKIVGLASGLSLFGGVWDQDGSLLFDNAPPEVQREGQSFVYRMTPGSGEIPQRVSQRQSPAVEAQMVQQILPDGAGYLISIYGERHVIDVLTPDGSSLGGRWTQLVDNASGGLYLPTGHLLFWRGGNLMAAPMSLTKLRLTGPPVAVVANVADSGWEGPDITVSRDGNLAYVRRGALVPDRRLIWVDHQGHETSLPIPPGPLEPLDVSRDGKKLLLTRFDPPKNSWGLWSYSLSNFDAQELPVHNPFRIHACWSPDGRQIIFSSNQADGKETNLYRMNADGKGDPEQLTHVDSGGNTPQSWSADGKWLAFMDGTRPDTKSDIWVMSLAGDGAPRPIVKTPGFDQNPSISPNGHWLAYAVQTAGNPDVFVVPFPEGGTPTKISPGSGPLWDPDGTRLYLRRGQQMLSVELDFPNTGGHLGVRVGESKTLFEGNYMSPGLWSRQQLISPDGLRFLMVKEEADPNEGRQIQVVVNWFAELQRLFRPE
jgi:Tol biopolymer transport system component